MFKFSIRYLLNRRAWNNLLQNKYLTDGLHQELRIGAAQGAVGDAEQARRRAEVARFREQSTLKGHLESSARRRGIDIDEVRMPYYTM